MVTPNPSPPQIHLLSSFGESAPTVVQGRESPGRNIAAKACEFLETKQLKPTKGHTVLDRPSFDPARGPNLGNRALRMALSGANLLGTPKSLKAASNVRPEDLRIKLLNLENKRLQADVNRSNAELYEARLDLSQCRCLLARAEEDLDASRRCHEQVLTELRLELAHQRELVEAYQQLTTAQKRIASFTSQGSATKRPRSPSGEHIPHAKKPKQDNNDPFERGISTGSNSGPIPRNISSMSSEGIWGPAIDSKAPENSTEQQYVRATDKHTRVVAKDYLDLDLHAPDGYDRYLPSSRRPKESSARTTLFEGRSDLYRPRGSGWRSTVDRYVPEAERNEATGSPPSRTVENPDTSRSEPKATLSQKPPHVLRCGDISEVRKISRGMNNFVLKNGPYAHAAQQPGIPRQCGRCFVTLRPGLSYKAICVRSMVCFEELELRQMLASANYTGRQYKLCASCYT